MFRIGIDLGGTKIEGIVLDVSGRELFRKRVDTQQEQGYDHILNRVKILHDELAAHIQNQPHPFGIGTPGAISPRTGLLKNSNTVCLNGRPLKIDLERMPSRQIEIQNDANCLAMACRDMDAVVIGFKNRAEIDEAIERMNRALQEV